MKKIEFKCMEWIRSIRDKHATELKGKTAQDRITFYRRKAQALHEKLEQEKVRA